MGRARRRERTALLATARRRVGRWRARCGGRGIRIPEELWDEAVAAARHAGVRATARALRLDPERLAARVTKAPPMARTEVEAKSEFVELGVTGWCPASRAVLRLASPDGDALYLEVTGLSAVDLAGVVQAFRGRRP